MTSDFMVHTDRIDLEGLIIGVALNLQDLLKTNRSEQHVGLC